MKKSKIIVPALGIICLSTAASITGTVAWFTASQSAKINAGNFAVTKTTNNLEVKLSSGLGTDASSNSEISVRARYRLTDASFNHKTSTIYKPDSKGENIADDTALSNAVDEGDVGENVRAHETKVVENETLDYYVLSVMTFKMEVTVAFGSVTGDMGLFLKTKGEGSSEVKLADSSEAAPDTAMGFRMAFVATSSSEQTSSGATRVWADLQDAANCRYVDHLSSVDTTQTPEEQKAIKGVPYDTQTTEDTYKYSDLIDKNYSRDLPGDSLINATNAAKRPDYLGKFGFIENKRVTLTFTVVCWFEGTDPKVVNRPTVDLYQTVESVIAIDTVKLAAA